MKNNSPISALILWMVLLVGIIGCVTPAPQPGYVPWHGPGPEPPPSWKNVTKCVTNDATGQPEARR